MEYMFFLIERLLYTLRRRVEKKSIKFSPHNICFDNKECFNNSIKSFFKNSLRGQKLKEVALKKRLLYPRHIDNVSLSSRVCDPKTNEIKIKNIL